MLRLNLGSGDRPIEGYENLDRKTGQEIYPLAAVDNSADEIRASHCLEHLPHGFVLDALKDWYRVLKPGGVIKIAVPNFEKIARDYLDGQDFPVQGYVMGGQNDSDDFHCTIFDAEILASALRHVGFKNIKRWTGDGDDCSMLPVSLNLQATKPKPLPQMKIACCMSVPRLGFMDNFFCWAKGLLPFGIQPMIQTGAFWGQCLERAMSESADSADPPDWILTVDYDTVFNREAVEGLIHLAAENDHADAIVPVQVKRGSGGLPLMTVEGDDGRNKTQIHRSEFIPDLLKIRTGHFGLSMIRVSALKQTPHPWFLGVPNSEGRWGEGRTDDDIYFWNKWREQGRGVYLASHVVVGHLQLMIGWPDMDFEPIYQNPTDFWKDGKPQGTWE